MIENFKDNDTKKIFHQYFDKKFPKDVQIKALRKLHLINYANDIQDLRMPPGNHLEKLNGKRNRQWSIRVNGTYRICFQIKNTNDFINVELTKHYHSN